MHYFSQKSPNINFEGDSMFSVNLTNLRASLASKPANLLISSREDSFTKNHIESR